MEDFRLSSVDAAPALWRKRSKEFHPMPFIVVSKGGPSAETDIPDGVYPLILTAISDPRTVTATRGPNSGKDIDLIDWTWTIDLPGSPLDGKQLDSSTSTASGPKSKLYSYLTALMGGVAPAPNSQFEKTELIARPVLGTINHDDEGWNRLANVSAVPAAMLQQKLAQATGTPVITPPAVNPVPTVAPAAPQPDLPF